MRILLMLTLSFLIGLTSINAQNSADCRSAIPVCADVPLMSEANGAGDIEDFDPDVIIQTGCLEKGSIGSANIENNTSWYVFRAGVNGRVGFDIEFLTTTAEWDFAVYGPDVDCGEISAGTAEPIRCNYEVNTTAFTGVGVNPETGEEGAPFLIGSHNTYDEWLDVQQGEIYYILINNFNTNFNGDAEPYSLTFTGAAVDNDQNTALDCVFRDEFLGLDINACIGDPDIVLNAFGSTAGPDIANVIWSVDYNDDGTIDQILANGPTEIELTVSSPINGRYFVEIETNFATTITDDVLITFHGPPVFREVEIIDDLGDSNNVRIHVEGTSNYEYALNGGEFRDSNEFFDIAPGINTVIINDKNGCGITEEIPFLVVGYPKFFTPNSDNVHDLWQIKGIETLTSATVFIFDRYGKLLKQLNQDSTGWDGTFNGKPMPSSDYWFKMEYSREENAIVVAKTLHTHFSLKR